VVLEAAFAGSAQGVVTLALHADPGIHSPAALLQALGEAELLLLIVDDELGAILELLARDEGLALRQDLLHSVAPVMSLKTHLVSPSVLLECLQKCSHVATVTALWAALDRPLWTDIRGVP